MSKALEGAALLGAAVALGTAAFFDPALVASPLFDKTLATLVMAGVSMEAGAIADALTQNRGANITTRQPASARQIIYGQQRVGGVMIYRSTTGGSKAQFNMVIVLASHPVDSIVNLYLDGRQVHWNVGSTGNVTTNGINFGGSANSNTYTGPDGTQYNFGGKVYCEARLGNQVASNGFIQGLQANDPLWAPTPEGTPYCGGCTYVYLKVEYDPALFPSEPEVKFTINGKNNIYDPRKGTSGYTSNAALIIADVLTDPIYGLGDNTVNQAQLIAAANVCDELVQCAGGQEARYACHYHYDTSVSPGDAITAMLPSMGGRLSRIGGEWYIWPAYWQGPSFSFDQTHLTGPVQWNPYRSFADKFNRVNGTYIAPSYPYNIAGNLYDRNGFYNGQIQNNFPFAFQPTNYPQYAADSVHGYAADQYLGEDYGVVLPTELALSCVLSVSQAQRLAKIHLMRNRFQKSGTFEMGLEAFQMQECDVMNFTSQVLGGTYQLEITGMTFTIADHGDGMQSVRLQVEVQETDISVYQWSQTEELTVYDFPTQPQQKNSTVNPPTGLSLLSDAGTAVQGIDGTVYPRIEVQWNTPQDGFVTQIQVQYQIAGASTWIDNGNVDVGLNSCFIGPVISGQNYNVQIRSLRPNGNVSVWVEANLTSGLVLSTSTTQNPIGPGSLVGEAFAGGVADIICNPFTAQIGNRQVGYFPAGAVTLSGVQQQQMYYVYVIDANLMGGNITPIATQLQSDFVGKLGYFLIDTVTLPVYTAPGSMRYAPSTSQDTGSRTTISPEAVWDGNLSTYSTSSGSSYKVGTSTVGACTYSGFPSKSNSYAVTLHCSVTQIVTSNSINVTVQATWTGGSNTLLNTVSSSGAHDYTCTIPANINLGTLSVYVSVDGSTGSGVTNATASIEISEIYAL